MSDFYTGSPVDPENLWFRDEFIERLWETLETEHVLLTAPRRTGKTSVMDHLAAKPRNGFTPITVFVQDLDHPGEFLLRLLDAFHDKHPDLFRSIFQTGSKLIGGVLGRLTEIGMGNFKVALREASPKWHDDWRTHGDDDVFSLIRGRNERLLFIVDEFPDLVLNMSRNNPELLRPFLGWFRGHCSQPSPKHDSVRWLLGGSVNLSGTLDALGFLDLINTLHDERLPVLTDEQVMEFVRRMLTDRNVKMTEEVPLEVVRHLGRPIPLFMQMITQDLNRIWKRKRSTLDSRDVASAFEDLIVSSAARDKLQHYYSRIAKYYDEPKRSAAYKLLERLSLHTDGLDRATLHTEFDRIATAQCEIPEYERKRLFNQLLRDLENDFYVEDIGGDRFDFASGLLKTWWRKYYA